MAQIIRFNKISRNSKVQGEIEAGYNVFVSKGVKYFQITTWGSNQREVRGAASQTIQLNEESAKTLLKLLKEEFA